MWTAILGALGPRILAVIAKLGIPVGAYVKGRTDQSAREELQGARARREAEDAVGRLPDSELDRRVRELER